MYKVDSEMLAKFPEARRLLRAAKECIREKEFGKAEGLAEEMAELGFPLLASDIYKGTGNIRKAREAVIPVAEERCREGRYLMAAGLYKGAGMLAECDSAFGKHCVQYELANKRKN